jgi:hypothetical protein
MKKGENLGMGISDTTIFILQIHLDVLLELLATVPVPSSK